MVSNSPYCSHPNIPRRAALQAGALGLVGLGMNHLNALRAETTANKMPATAKSAIYIFLSGGLSQHESFDPKPDAPAEIRGDFHPIQTATPGLQICEHLPELAKRSSMWSICRSLSHPTNGHPEGHHIMLTGRTMLPPGFNGSLPKPTDWPSLASIVGDLVPPRNNLPPAAVLPERLVHYSGRVIPGQFGGMMGSQHDPWFIEASSYDSLSYGAYPPFGFDHQDRPQSDWSKRTFQAPSLVLPEGLTHERLGRRSNLLAVVEQQRRQFDRFANAESFDGHRQTAMSLLTDSKVQQAIDVTKANDAVQDRYGRNSFGWSLLMARRLVEAGVNLVQVNLGNNETWDTHGEMYPHLKDKLFPPTDQAICALLDDLSESGMLDSTFIVMAGEFGRTPKISHLPQHYKLPGRDHWGAVQSVWFAGGGVQGGRVIGSTDKIGGYPASDPQKPENMAATLYHCLGLPDTAAWYDDVDRPHHIYYGEPIHGLLS
ncbi:MAG: DUF1501 domain-containing protein [Planctomycetota bacterium]|nr:DUF1501 domain-containing protein [Planctomycetota bacterium]MDA1214006.1 DUF1501 domain-containing protein [Planctomycetota bacterium]